MHSIASYSKELFSIAYHYILCYTIECYAIWLYTMRICKAILYHYVILWNITQCYVLLYYIVSWCTILYCTKLCYSILYYIIYYATLSYSMCNASSGAFVFQHKTFKKVGRCGGGSLYRIYIAIIYNSWQRTGTFHMFEP